MQPFGLILRYIVRIKFKNLMRISFTLILLFFVRISVFSQTTTAGSSKGIDPYRNPVILSHYSVADLHDIEANDSLKFTTIVYYYTQSFFVEKIDCSDCVQQDLSAFDVAPYENLRLKHDRYVRTFEKYGFKLTLLSVDELLYKLPTQLLH